MSCPKCGEELQTVKNCRGETIRICGRADCSYKEDEVSLREQEETT